MAALSQRMAEEARREEALRRGAEAIRRLTLCESPEGREILRAEHHAEVEARGEIWLGDPTMLTQQRRANTIRNSTSEWDIASAAFLLHAAPAPHGWSTPPDIAYVVDEVGAAATTLEVVSTVAPIAKHPPKFSSVKNLFGGAGKSAGRAGDLADLANDLNDAGRVSRTHCFTAGTQVVMADQEQAMVADDAVLESGDWLIASLAGLAVGGSTLAKSRRKNGQPLGEEEGARTDGSDALPEDDVSHNKVTDPDVAEESAIPHSAGDSCTDRPRPVRWRAIGAALLSGAIALVVALLLLGRSPQHDQAATPLASARPQTKAIESVAVGDIVLAKDPQTGKVGPRTVTQVFRRQSDHLRLLDLCSHDGTEQRIETTDEHPFWVEGQGWIEAAELAVGDRLEQSAGDWATVVATTRQDEPAGVPVYNIEVDGVHTYYVASRGTLAPPVLVHNCDTPETLRHRNGCYEALSEQPITGTSRSAHRNSANKNLLKDIEADPRLNRQLSDELGVDDVAEHMRSGKGKNPLNPPGTEWHHPTDRPDRMELLRGNDVHRADELQDILHPGPNGAGGYSSHYGGN